jgi:hypothetical protein
VILALLVPLCGCQILGAGATTGVVARPPAAAAKAEVEGKGEAVLPLPDVVPDGERRGDLPVLPHPEPVKEGKRR